MSVLALDAEHQPGARPTGERNARDTLAADLEASIERETVLLQEKRELSQRQVMLTQEFEHRLINSLQLIVSLLTLQSRAARTPEAAAQLTIAARRVGALGRVHRQLHLLDREANVRFNPYLRNLCEDLSDLLMQEGSNHGIELDCEDVEIPTSFAIPLGFIVNELITNSAKYAGGNIAVSFSATSPGRFALAVLDDGPGLPRGFDATKCTGLGMKIVSSLVKQIDGELHITPGEHGRGACFTVAFGAHPLAS